ncbi:MAG: erythromycin esterase family protein [Bacteroidales bacterium]|jgi:erythromycin esterase|nr:erythromycin esterase family protein [Bacteroidales bacterium]
MQYVSIILFFLFVGCTNHTPSSSDQKFLNLGFEFGNEQAAPLKWMCGGNGYRIHLDEEEYIEGKKSLKMEYTNSSQKTFGVCTGLFPIELVRGKEITFKGKIKTEKLENGYAGLWCRIDGENGKILGFDNMYDRGVSGDSTWNEYTIHMKVDSSGISMYFGALHTGEGKAWFDDFEIWIDGKKYIDGAPRLTPPNRKEIAWLNKHIYPLRTFNPAESDDSDMEIIGKLTENIEILGLGESTHGSKEIFMMKHRILKYMCEKKGFNIFSIEANMPESYKLNQYIIDGEGDPVELIKGMYFWTWRTREVLDMVNWMKDHNQIRKNKLYFTGFDMQFFEGAIRELDTFFQSDKKTLGILSELFDVLFKIKHESRQNRGNVSLSEDQKEKIDGMITTIREAIEKSGSGQAKTDWARQNARIIEQFLDKNYLSRDKYMAENLMWIKKQNPETGIVAWAHNGHVKKTGKMMGEYLSRSLGEQYVSIGFAFHDGNYTAVGSNGLNTYEAQPSYIGTYEYFFNAVDAPIFLLDLKKAKEEDNDASRWLTDDELAFRNVGAVNMSHEFSDTKLVDDFDYIIFIKKSTHSELLEE